MTLGAEISTKQVKIPEQVKILNIWKYKITRMTTSVSSEAFEKKI